MQIWVIAGVVVLPTHLHASERQRAHTIGVSLVRLMFPDDMKIECWSAVLSPLESLNCCPPIDSLILIPGNSWLIWPFFPSSAFSTSFCNALALQVQHIRLEIHDFPINTEERKIKFNEKNEFKFNLKNEGWNLNYSQIIILWYKHHG